MTKVSNTSILWVVIFLVVQDSSGLLRTAKNSSRGDFVTHSVSDWLLISTTLQHNLLNLLIWVSQLTIPDELRNFRFGLQLLPFFFCLRFPSSWASMCPATLVPLGKPAQKKTTFLSGIAQFFWGCLFEFANFSQQLFPSKISVN